MLSIRFNSIRFLPSKDAYAECLEVCGTWIFNTTESGSNIGRKLNECGQIGVTLMLLKELYQYGINTRVSDRSTGR
jgi:hypothetical protein